MLDGDIERSLWNIILRFLRNQSLCYSKLHIGPWGWDKGAGSNSVWFFWNPFKMVRWLYKPFQCMLPWNNFLPKYKNPLHKWTFSLLSLPSYSLWQILTQSNRRFCFEHVVACGYFYILITNLFKNSTIHNICGLHEDNVITISRPNAFK